MAKVMTDGQGDGVGGFVRLPSIRETVSDVESLHIFRIPIILAPVCAAPAESETEQGYAVDSDSGPTSCYRNSLVGTMPEAGPPLSRFLNAIVGGLCNWGML